MLGSSGFFVFILFIILLLLLIELNLIYLKKFWFVLVWLIDLLIS